MFINEPKRDKVLGTVANNDEELVELFKEIGFRKSSSIHRNISWTRTPSEKWEKEVNRIFEQLEKGNFEWEAGFNNYSDRSIVGYNITVKTNNHKYIFKSYFNGQKISHFTLHHISSLN